MYWLVELNIIQKDLFMVHKHQCHKKGVGKQIHGGQLQFLSRRADIIGNCCSSLQLGESPSKDCLPLVQLCQKTLLYVKSFFFLKGLLF